MNISASRSVAPALVSLGTFALFLATFTGFPLARASTPPSSDHVVVEWAPFQLADGAKEAALLRASEVVQREFLSKQPGFIRRELLRGRGNQWVDLVYWTNMEDAKRAMENAAQSAACGAYFELMVAADPSDPSAGVHHFDQLASYSNGSN